MIDGNTKNLQYIITDPCYIMDDTEYDALGQSTDWNMDFKDTREFTRRYHTDQKIKIFKNRGTKNGDGCALYHGQKIGVDSGQLCIAFNELGWKDERDGATFDTLQEAKKAWQSIYRRF